MTAVEVTEKAEKSPNKGKTTITPSPSEEKKEGSDDASVTSTSSQKKSSSKTTNWLGKEVKRPRAAYQAEIDELKLKIAAIEVDLESKTVELQQFKDWVGMAPSAF